MRHRGDVGSARRVQERERESGGEGEMPAGAVAAYVAACGRDAAPRADRFAEAIA